MRIMRLMGHEDMRSYSSVTKRYRGAVIAVCILFPRVTKYILYSIDNMLYRFKVTGSVRLASNLQYPPSHPSEALYCAFCVRLSLEMFCFEPDTALIQM